MLDEADKTFIKEIAGNGFRLKVETPEQLKLNPPAQPPKSFFEKYVNSKIGLLIIGAILSGVLVPWFQFSQKNLDWKRQTDLEKLQYTVERMKDTFQDILLLSAQLKNAEQTTSEFFELSHVTGSQKQSLLAKLENVREENLQTEIRVLFHLKIYFGKDPALEAAYAAYRTSADNYFHDLNDLVEHHFCAENSDLRSCKGNSKEQWRTLVSGLRTRLGKDYGNLQDQLYGVLQVSIEDQMASAAEKEERFWDHVTRLF